MKNERIIREPADGGAVVTNPPEHRQARSHAAARQRTALVRLAAVQVWQWSLGEIQAAGERLLARLPPDEHERSAQFRREADRWRFIGARSALRTLLGARLHLPPREVPLRTSVHGKPELAPGIKPRLRFNVAHSGDVVLVVLSPNAEVGVDVEALRPLPDALPLAERFFSASEATALKALPDGQQLRTFYRLWTRKEAVLKAIGLGIGHGLATVEVTCGAQAAVHAVDGNRQAGTQWTLRELEPAPGHLGAVAVAAPDADLIFHNFNAEAFS